MKTGNLANTNQCGFNELDNCKPKQRNMELLQVNVFLSFQDWKLVNGSLNPTHPPVLPLKLPQGLANMPG